MNIFLKKFVLIYICKTFVLFGGTMKRILSLTILTLMLFSGFACARCKYDSTGRHLIYDDTIRGRRKAAQQQVEQQAKIQAAAAAKINYDYDFNYKPSTLKSNYIQNKNGETRVLPESTLRSNYIQRREF